MSLLATLPLAAAAAAAAPGASNAARNEAAYKFAACLVKVAPAETRSLVMMDVRTSQYTQRLAGVIDGPAQKCKKKAEGLDFGAAMLGGMVAEVLLHSRFQPTIAVEDLKIDPRYRTAAPANADDSLGLCAVAKAPSAATQFLGTQMGSAGETRLAEVVRTAANSCIGPGSRIKASAAALRAMVSLAAWRSASSERAR